ncbi:hypothetical protein NL822_17390 [Klebsiella quasipneumoniae]|uniref:hypothetical protein n=1 Tax=Klebsiella quasipneumoniae TaxID=1463165 RepID=UPI000DFBB723|nr:hypothetical protein [Klebsiella quasipneumoniae]MCP6737352.1 hypothetical protein [Klebsiella quasipneumoniae]MCP6748161.1 hypothetical protein [Klebsiella quasipneumoniae]STW01254.1 Uncharacterised protein [Klebsiella pneumoniae]HBR1056985.1 hypothetical protein [Klebsiella quasipneumoniae subsp. similipneumoniae]
MTAEIVVINNTGIALAADSAVTTEHNRLIKINNSAEKLFELSKHHPVGIMVYNNAALGGAPWELIIKSYRKQLGTEKFGTVNEYVHDFLHYINKNEDLITPSMRQSCVINLVIDNIKGLMQHINSNNIVNYLTLNPGTNINNNIFQSIVKQQIDNEINALRNNPFFEGFDERDLGEIITYISDVIKPLIPSVIVLDNFESLEEDLIDKIILYSSYLICKVHTSRTYSGIVITGYGDNEFYPSINTLHVFGIYKDRIMFRYVEDKTHNNISNNGYVIPFAQEDEVLTFIDGCNPNINVFTNTLSEEIFDRLNNFIESNIYPSLNNQLLEGQFKTEVSQLKNLIMSDYDNKLNSYIENNHTKKMTSMLQSLGKADLAYMAESLVNLTAFKRKVSHEYETVGGPVDVAVLSKVDGFVWVKRKHYFPKELNSNFFKR